jgi:hypothetical protein
VLLKQLFFFYANFAGCVPVKQAKVFALKAGVYLKSKDMLVLHVREGSTFIEMTQLFIASPLSRTRLLHVVQTCIAGGQAKGRKIFFCKLKE